MSESHPLVHVVVLNYNGRAVLDETLDTVCAMTYPSMRLIVVDNASSDGSLQIARDRFPSVHCIENATNLGFGEGNNVGIQHALENGAEWVLLLNNDVVVDRELLSELVRVGESDTSIGIVAPKIYHHDRPTALWYAGGRVNYWTGIVAHRGLRQDDRGQYDRAEETDYATGCAILLRRSMCERVGLFDPVYSPAYGEDADLCVRASRAGFRIVYAPAGRLWHKISTSSGGGATPFKTQLKVEHNLILMKRYARWYHWLTIPWFVGMGAIAFVVRELFRGNARTVVALARGFIAGVGRLRST